VRILEVDALSRISAIAGALSGVTMRPRSPSGMNRIKLRGVLFCASAALAVRAIRLMDNNAMARRMDIPPKKANCGKSSSHSFRFVI